MLATCFSSLSHQLSSPHILFCFTFFTKDSLSFHPIVFKEKPLSFYPLSAYYIFKKFFFLPRSVNSFKGKFPFFFHPPAPSYSLQEKFLFLYLLANFSTFCFLCYSICFLFCSNLFRKFYYYVHENFLRCTKDNNSTFLR